MVDAAGTTKYTYYTGGLLNTEDGPWASDTVTYTYNNRMRASLSLQQPTGAWTNGYTWDAAHRLGTETSPAGTFTYTYQSPGRLVKKLALPNTSYITNTYDNAARLTGTYLDNSANTVLDKAEYLYNFGNQRTRLTRTDGSYYTNSYDNIGQLKWADSTVNTEDRGYLYDAAWNLNKLTNNGAVTTFTVDSKNQLTSGLQLNYSYDANGNLYDADGASAYEYDDENQLVAAEMVDDYRIEFLYDGRGRMRVRRDYSWNVGWTQIGETRYVYDGMRAIQERNSSNTPLVTYTRGPDLSGSLEGAGGIGGLLARSHGYSSGNWTTHNYYHADGNGNITAMVDSSQLISASYRYDPFGNTISKSGSLADANVYRFSSKERIYADGLELYYYGYRFYEPDLQRWPNRDPIMETGGINLYGFVGNDPVSTTDKFGLEKDRDCVKKCHEQYGWDFGLSTGVGVGVGLGQIEHFGPKGRPRIPYRRGITGYGRGLCRVGYAAVLGFLADNVGEHGGIALEGCLSGCPDQIFWVDPHSPLHWPILGPDPLTPPNCKRNVCW